LWDWFGKGLKEVINNDVISNMNWVIDKINGLTHGLSDIWSWAGAPSIGKIDHIPKLAQGGIAVRPGWAIVGDNGPELMPMQPGTAVVPLDDATRRAAVGPVGEGYDGGGVHIGQLDVHVTGIVDLTNPNAMSAGARRMVIQLRDALRNIEGQYA
jgi:hypothetical protein